MEKFVGAIRSVARREQIASPRVLTSPFSHVASLRDENHPTLVPQLSKREEQILQLMAEGLSNKEIAKKNVLATSDRQKLRAHDLQELDNTVGEK